MKTRNDFVSNSSSSSFIVISDKGQVDVPAHQKDSILLPCDYGCKAFNWQIERYYDFYSKLNWCAIIIMSLEEQERCENSSDKIKVDIAKPWFKSSEMKDMLVRVCKEKFALNVKVSSYEVSGEDDCSVIDEFFDLGGIDHQSNVGECPENARMFMSEKMLYDFLSNNHSFIDNSNDNGGRESSDFDDMRNKWVYDPPIPDDYEE